MPTTTPTAAPTAAPAAPSSVAGVSAPGPADPLADLADALKQAWRDGAPPDAAAAVREHPELLRRRSLVVDLAYEEYCLREEAEAAPDPEQFCRRLPVFRSEVREVLRGHRVLADNPELFARGEVVWPAPGDRFEGLTITRELGRGAFARAYLARDPDAGGRPVVLKLSPAPSGEARTLGPMAHPHVVGVHWARAAGGLHAICMPFVGAATLGDVIGAAFGPPGDRRSARTVLGAADPGDVPAPHAAPASPLLRGRESYPEAVAAVGAKLADTLAFLDRAGVSHGDVKPSNVILAPGGHPYLIDFNLSTGPADPALRCGGTLPYMAPERVRVFLGEARVAGPAGPADMYSLGAVLFEALTGAVPFELIAFNDPKWVAADLLCRQAEGPPRFPAGCGVPGPLARIVRRCLAADPRRRPSAAALAGELGRYLRRRARRARLLAAGAGLLGFGLVLAAWPPWAVPAAAVEAEPKTADEYFARGAKRLRASEAATDASEAKKVFEQAKEDLDAAHRLRPTGENTAFLAYCHARSPVGHDVAADLYLQALTIHHYGAAWVHNNRAFSLIQLQSEANLHLAVAEASAAIEREPGLRAAHLNRAYALYLLLPRPKARNLVDLVALADVKAVMDVGPYTADLYYKAALILAALGGGREELHARTVEYLRGAVSLGRSGKSLTGDPVLKAHLGDRDDFKAIADLKAPDPAPAANLHVISPPER